MTRDCDVNVYLHTTPKTSTDEMLNCLNIERVKDEIRFEGAEECIYQLTKKFKYNSNDSTIATALRMSADTSAAVDTNFTHYIVDSERTLSSKCVFFATECFLESNQFQVKRIRKSHFLYLRLSISEE